MIRGFRAWCQARAQRRTAHHEWGSQTLDAALREALPGSELAPSVTDDGWACARGALRSGAALEVRLSGGGLLDVVINGAVGDTDFPWGDSLGDRTPQAALAESLIEIVRPVEMGDG